MKFISWNVNGIRASVKKGFIDIVNDLNADFFCIQETKAQTDQTEEALKDLKGYHIYSHHAIKKGYSGVTILSKVEAISESHGIGVEEHDMEGRVITLEFDSFYLVNVYVPNSGSGLKRLDYRKTWDDAFLNFLKTLEEKKPLVVTGDFNVAHQPIDLARPKSNYNKTSGYTQVEIDGMDAFHNAGFIDTYRFLHPEKVEYTFWSVRFGARAKNVGWRIDYFLISPTLKDSIEEAFILTEIMGSDHCPLGLELNL